MIRSFSVVCFASAHQRGARWRQHPVYMVHCSILWPALEEGSAPLRLQCAHKPPSAVQRQTDAHPCALKWAQGPAFPQTPGRRLGDAAGAATQRRRGGASASAPWVRPPGFDSRFHFLLVGRHWAILFSHKMRPMTIRPSEGPLGATRR